MCTILCCGTFQIINVPLCLCFCASHEAGRHLSIGYKFIENKVDIQFLIILICDVNWIRLVLCDFFVLLTINERYIQKKMCSYRSEQEALRLVLIPKNGDK